MNNVVSATELKNKASEILNRVIFTNTEMIVERHGKPVAKIVPITGSKESRKIDLKAVLDETFGSLPDFPEVTNGNRFPRPKGRGSLIFAQNSLLGPQSGKDGQGPHDTEYLWNESCGFFAQNKFRYLCTHKQIAIFVEMTVFWVV